MVNRSARPSNLDLSAEKVSKNLKPLISPPNTSLSFNTLNKIKAQANSIVFPTPPPTGVPASSSHPISGRSNNPCLYPLSSAHSNFQTDDSKRCSVPILRHQNATISDLLNRGEDPGRSSLEEYDLRLKYPSDSSTLSSSSSSRSPSSYSFSNFYQNNRQDQAKVKRSNIAINLGNSNPGSYHNETGTLDPLAWVIDRWLKRNYRPDPTGSDPVPEIDILVGLKSICDRFERFTPTGLSVDRYMALTCLKRSFPSSDFNFSSRLTNQPGLRSNQELVLYGLSQRLRQPPLEYYIRSIDLRERIPSELNSSLLTEALRQRVCELEDELLIQVSINTYNLTNSRLETGLAPINDQNFCSESIPSNFTSVDKLQNLCDRIWVRFLRACQDADLQFQIGKPAFVSWYDDLQNNEFKLIQKYGNREGNDSLSVKSIRIVSPFTNPNKIFGRREKREFQEYISSQLREIRDGLAKVIDEDDEEEDEEEETEVLEDERDRIEKDEDIERRRQSSKKRFSISSLNSLLKHSQTYDESIKKKVEEEDEKKQSRKNKKKNKKKKKKNDDDDENFDRRWSGSWSKKSKLRKKIEGVYKTSNSSKKEFGKDKENERIERRSNLDRIKLEEIKIEFNPVTLRARFTCEMNRSF